MYFLYFVYYINSPKIQFTLLFTAKIGSFEPDVDCTLKLIILFTLETTYVSIVVKFEIEECLTTLRDVALK